MKTFKSEEVDGTLYQQAEHARLAIASFMAVFIIDSNYTQLSAELEEI